MLSVNKWKHTLTHDYMKAAYTICWRGKFDVTFKGSLNMIIFLFTYNGSWMLLEEEKMFKKNPPPADTLFSVSTFVITFLFRLHSASSIHSKKCHLKPIRHGF